MLTRPAVLLPAGTVALALAAACARAPQDPHARVACASCHREGATPQYKGAVPDAACMAAQCHADGGPERVQLALTSFNHRDHTRGGPWTTSCAQCHTHPADSLRLRADLGACALCHFDQVARDDGCQVCHPSPRHERTTSQGVPISHAAIADARVSCTRCHYRLADGEPRAAPARCASCHPDSAHATVPPADTAHATHRGLACRSCHTAIRHRVVAMSSSVQLECAACHSARHARPLPPDTIPDEDCGACHRDVHAAVQRLLLGALPGEPLMPSPMFVGGVTCRSCHFPSGSAPLRPGTSARATPAACVHCHGPEWSAILSRWTRGFGRRSSWITAYQRQAEGALQRAGAARNAFAWLEQSRRFLAFVDSARPEHNVEAADRAMRVALDAARQAYAVAGLQAPRAPDLGPPVRAGSCLACHYGVEEAPAGRDTLTGRAFDHAQHLFRAFLPCESCHAAGAAPPGLPDSAWMDTTRLERARRQRRSN